MSQVCLLLKRQLKIRIINSDQMETLSEMNDRLQKSLAAGDFAEAERLLPAYVDDIVRLVSSRGPADDIAAALDQFSGLLSLARVMRAHVASELAALERQSCYRFLLPASETSAWQFTG